MLTQTLAHIHTKKSAKVCREINASTCAHKNTRNQDKLWYSRVLTGWHSWSQHHTYRKEEKESKRVSALESDGG